MERSELIKSYLKFCSIRDGSTSDKCINLEGESWFYPTALLPLGDFIQAKRDEFKFIQPSDGNLCNYINLMIYPPIGSLKKNRSYAPLARLPKDDPKNGASALHTVYPERGDWKSYGGRNTYMEIISELTDNVYEHSSFNNGMVMGQRYDNKGFIEACVFDNGITIAGSYEKALNVKFSGLEAIQKAVEGLSTKSSKERGTGLQNTIKLVLHMKGEVLLVSGDGMIHGNFSDTTGFNLREPNTLNGTLVAIRFPIQTEEVNLYEIIK
jgi:hypothetical protein